MISIVFGLNKGDEMILRQKMLPTSDRILTNYQNGYLEVLEFEVQDDQRAFFFDDDDFRKKELKNLLKDPVKLNRILKDIEYLDKEDYFIFLAKLNVYNNTSVREILDSNLSTDYIYVEGEDKQEFAVSYLEDVYGTKRMDLPEEILDALDWDEVFDNIVLNDGFIQIEDEDGDNAYVFMQ